LATKDAPETLDLTGAKWAILDAWGGILAQGSERKETTSKRGRESTIFKSGISPVRLVPGRLYAIVIATNRNLSDVAMPPTYAWFCPSSGRPVTTDPKTVSFDKEVGVFFPSLASIQENESQIVSHLLRMDGIISRAISRHEAGLDDDSDIVRIQQQIRGILDRFGKGGKLADLRDLPKQVDVFVHLVKDSPQTDGQWEQLRKTALNTKYTKFWAVCDTTNKAAFANYFAHEKTGKSISKFQILGYLPVVKNNGYINESFSEQQLIQEAQIWYDCGVRGVFIDFFDPNMQLLGESLRRMKMIVFAHLREPLYDESRFNTPYVDAFIISNGVIGPAYDQIRSLTQKQLLPANNGQSIARHLRFGAFERNTAQPEQRAFVFQRMIEARCSLISMGMPDLVQNPNGNQVFVDQLHLSNFWNDFITHTEQHNAMAATMKLRLQKILAIP
jgi:hypothetical protein